MGFLDIFRTKKAGKEVEKVKVESATLDYHPKIILAWAKAIDGNKDLLNYLETNDFKELVFAVYAIKLEDKARDWLMNNGFAHIMAMINAAEGNKQAKSWLQHNGFTLLYNIAEAVDGEENGKEGFEWLKRNTTPDIYILAQSIKQVKDDIEQRHNDVHFFG